MDFYTISITPKSKKGNKIFTMLAFILIQTKIIGKKMQILHIHTAFDYLTIGYICYIIL